MYIRKEIREFIEKMPKEMRKPKHWRKFVNEQSVRCNLIIKHGKEYECTNCGKIFLGQQKERRMERCPVCNNQYTVRRSNLKDYFFLYDLALIDNIDNKIIVRYFEIKRIYDYKTRRFKNKEVEYARIVPELDVELVNDRFARYMKCEKVYYTKKIESWRVFHSKYGLSQYYNAIYLDNIKEKLKGTIYEYSPIKEGIEYLGNYKINIFRILDIAKKYQSYEFLMKAGLYNLAMEYPEKFNIKGSFEKRFNIKKELYPFMKKHNISYKELCVLQMINKPNIYIIRSLLRISNSYIEDLKKTSEYVNLLQIEEYSKTQIDFFISNYLDYISNMEKLGKPLTKKILFPKDFKEAHDESIKKVKVVNDKILMEKIKERANILNENRYDNGIFFIRPAETLEDMKDEAKQQNNCVYTNYSEPYAKGETDIYFLRRVTKPEKSLVTVEVRNGNIRQKYQKGSKLVTKEQNQFLDLWEKQVLKAA